MSETAIYDAAPSAAPEKGGGQRSIFVLIVLFLIAFAIATAFQIKARRDDAAHMIFAAQQAQAALIAERVNANLALAMGAASSAAELARPRGQAPVDPRLIVSAAAHAAPAHAAALIGPEGEILAITDIGQADFVRAAMAASRAAALWIGAPDMGALTTAPAIRRWSQCSTLLPCCRGSIPRHAC